MVGYREKEEGLPNESDERNRVCERSRERLGSVRARSRNGRSVGAVASDRTDQAFDPHRIDHLDNEMRTPMTAILGFAELLLDPDQSPDERKTYAETIQQSGRHLLTILDSILDLTRIASDSLPIRMVSCSPTEILAEVETMMRPMAVDQGLNLRVAYEGRVPGRITTDPKRVRQVLINLVDNAIKFSTEGEVRISVRTISRENAQTLCFCVEDSGCGIAPEETERVFEPFVQADSTPSRRFPGSGLGLTIAHGIVESLGGEIWVESELGRGSVFRFTIGPIDDSGAERPNGTDRSPRAADTHFPAPMPCRVLVAEAAPHASGSTSDQLARLGARVSVAETAGQASEMAMNALAGGEPYDLVFIENPEESWHGCDVTAALRDQGYTHPIITVTHGDVTERCQRCLQNGCSDFVPRTGGPDLLARLVSRYGGGAHEDPWAHEQTGSQTASGPAPSAKDPAGISPEEIEALYVFIGNLPSLVESIDRCVRHGELTEAGDLAAHLARVASRVHCDHIAEQAQCVFGLSHQANAGHALVEAAARLARLGKSFSLPGPSRWPKPQKD